MGEKDLSMRGSLRKMPRLESNNILRFASQTLDRNCVDNKRTANLESGH